MARKREKLVTSANETTIPQVFTASSLLFKEWLEQEVKKRSQPKQIPDRQDNEGTGSDCEEEAPSLPRKRVKV